MTPFDPRLQPIWSAAELIEPVLFIGQDDGWSEARLLFPARQILAIGDAAGTRRYAEGDDYRVDLVGGRLERPPTSRMPLVRPDDLVEHDVGRMYARLVEVTYVPEVDPGPVIAPDATEHPLAAVIDRLRIQEPVSVCVVGDSISEGYDASGFHGVAPHRPGYASLVRAGLEDTFGGPLRWHNLAIAGSSAADGRWMAPAVLDTAPDLLVIAYGMNDAAWAEAEEYAANLATLVGEVRAVRSETEVLLVAPMLPAPACHWVRPARFAAYREALVVLAEQVGGAVADVTSLWTAVVERKSPYDLTANGTNHPNDFGHWLYARVILQALGA